jgi:hypothetical protein
MMMTADNLCVILDDMLKDTVNRKIKWRVEIATSEYQDQEDKPVVEADGTTWTVDECYVAYSCEFRGDEFSMISYENMECSGETSRTTNLIFLPPIAMRMFHLDELAPYALEATAPLIERVHRLWELLLKMYRTDSNSVIIDAHEIKVKE